MKLLRLGVAISIKVASEDDQVVSTSIVSLLLYESAGDLYLGVSGLKSSHL